MPPYSPILGHLGVLGDMYSRLPPDISTHGLFSDIGKQFPNGVFCVDLWPFNSTTIVATNPASAAQVQAAELNKDAGISETLKGLIGGDSMLTMEYELWKKWRGLFNPGFAGGYMLEMAPAIAQEVAIFRDILMKHAKAGDVFQLSECSLRMTIDVIGAVSM
jgi:sterigmatocystin biosynthesis cytochrome P450 monooxygenase